VSERSIDPDDVEDKKRKHQHEEEEEEEEEEEKIEEKAKHKETKEEEKEKKKEKEIEKKEKEEKEKEKKKEEKEKEEEEEEEESKVIEEKTVTINLRHAYLTYGRKAAPKAVRLIKKITQRIADTEEVKIHNDLNAKLWSRGKTKTLRKISIKVQKLEDGTARVLPAEA